MMSMPVWLKEKLFLKKLIYESLDTIEKVDRKKAKLLFPEHHLSHAASAYYPSKYEKAAILTIDGVGEWDVQRGQQNAAVALEELWNRLARTRRFALLCGYRLDVFDRQSQVATLRDVCNLHTHVVPSADDDRLAHAVDDALVGVLGAQGAGQVYSLVGPEIRERRVPPPQLALMWVSENMPMNAERILAAARTRYLDTPASLAPASTADGAPRRLEPEALRALLRKATRTRRLF